MIYIKKTLFGNVSEKEGGPEAETLTAKPLDRQCKVGAKSSIATIV
jgi:hypothetical protein